MVFLFYNFYVWYIYFVCEDNIFGIVCVLNEMWKRGELIEGMIGEFYEDGLVCGLSMF